MWIRTQDEKMLLDVKCLQIIEAKGGWGIVTKEEYEPLAVYSTYDKARYMLGLAEDALVRFPQGICYLRKEEEL